MKFILWSTCERPLAKLINYESTHKIFVDRNTNILQMQTHKHTQTHTEFSSNY